MNTKNTNLLDLARFGKAGLARTAKLNHSQAVATILRARGQKALYGRYTATQRERASAYLTGLQAAISGSDMSELAARQQIRGGGTSPETMVKVYEMAKADYRRAA